MQQNQPIYLQISTYIENEILNGHLKTDDQVPSTNEFARIMQINPATAGKGLNELVDAGILYKRRGLGMFVTQEAYALLIQKRQEEFKQTLLPHMIQEARRLGIHKDALIEMIRGTDHAENK